MNTVRYENEWPCPKGEAIAKWRWGGEMGMGGPEWGWLAVTGLEEIKGAIPKVLWSQDGQLLAFVKFHIEDVPGRQGAEGFTFRVGLVRLADKQIRYCFGNVKLSQIVLKSLDSKRIEVSIDGEPKSVSIDSIKWDEAK